MKMPNRNIELLSRKRLSALFAMTGVLLICSAAAGQTGKDKGKPQTPTFVKLSILVTDSAGQPVTDVHQDDLQILEEGVPQTITSFTRREGPLCYGLAVDSSGSMHSSIDDAIAASKFAISLNNPDD